MISNKDLRDKINGKPSLDVFSVRFNFSEAHCASTDESRSTPVTDDVTDDNAELPLCSGKVFSNRS